MELLQTLDDMVTRLSSVKQGQGSAQVLSPDRYVIKMIPRKTKRRTVRQQNMKYIEYSCRKEDNRREKFLGKPDMTVHRADMIAAIGLFCPSGWCRGPARGSETMLMTHMLQNWFNPADEGLEGAVYDSCSFCSSIRPGFFGWQIQDAAAFLEFRSLFGKHKTGGKIFAGMKECPWKAGLMRCGRNAADAAASALHAALSSDLFMLYDLFADGVNNYVVNT